MKSTSTSRLLEDTDDNTTHDDNKLKETILIVEETTTELGPLSVQLTCPHCHQKTRTKVDYKSGRLVWITCFIMYLFICIIFLWVPFCVDTLKDAEHYCLNCKSYIGRYNRC